MGNFHETSDIGALHVVDVAIFLLAVLDALGVDVVHDSVELLIHFLFAPLQVHGVLAHFEARSGHAAGVDSLAGGIHDFALDESVDRFRCAAHVGNFGYAPYLVGKQMCGVFTVDFVLGSAGRAMSQGTVQSLVQSAT